MHEVDMTRALLLAMEGWRQSHSSQVPRVGTVHLQAVSYTHLTLPTIYSV